MRIGILFGLVGALVVATIVFGFALGRVTCKAVDSADCLCPLTEAALDLADRNGQQADVALEQTHEMLEVYEQCCPRDGLQRACCAVRK